MIVYSVQPKLMGIELDHSCYFDYTNLIHNYSRSFIRHFEIIISLSTVISWVNLKVASYFQKLILS